MADTNEIVYKIKARGILTISYTTPVQLIECKTESLKQYLIAM